MNKNQKNNEPTQANDTFAAGNKWPAKRPVKETYTSQRGYENLQIRIFPGVGEYEMPRIQPTRLKTRTWRPFNEAKTTKKKDGIGIQIFVDDYQFLRLWNDPRKYINMLSGFTQVTTPDFSMFTDFPIPIQIYNHYRKHWLGAYWQDRGIDVIPTISWSTRESYKWCFDGEPKNGAVAVSSVGCMNSAEKKRLFLDGYFEMMERLNPTEILFVGIVPNECTGNIINIAPYQAKFEGGEI